MKEDIEKKIEIRNIEKAYEFLISSGQGQDITIRDNEFDFSWVLDSVKRCRKKGFRFRLIDSGQLDLCQLEWLALSGADLYVSDQTRSEFFGLDLLSKSCKKSDSLLAYFHQGLLEESKSEVKSQSLTFSEILHLGRNGAYIYVTNRERARDFFQLENLAYICQKGGSWLVYYHYGQLDPSLERLGRNGAWIHITEQSLQEEKDKALIFETVRSMRAVKAKLVLHVGREFDYSFLRDIFKIGAALIFESPLFDYRSSLRNLERQARQRNCLFEKRIGSSSASYGCILSISRSKR